MVDLKTLQQLIKLMADNDLSELDVEDAKGEKFKLKRGHNGPQVVAVPAVEGQSPASSPTASASEVSGASGVAGVSGGVAIDSPMVGTFYSASSPDAEPFVSVGAKVTPETVVCVIEAMKVFNEIKAEVTGTIEQILVENGQAVEFAQPLFMVNKS